MTNVDSYTHFLSPDECQNLVNGQGYDNLYDKLSIFLKIDKSRFEPVKIVKYKIGEGRLRDKDYFTGVGLEKICRFGGNRVTTAIIFLNDVRVGGEINFPWLRKWEKAEEGKLIVVEYNEPNARLKIKSEYSDLPPITDEKNIAVIHIREKSLQEEILTPVRNYHFHKTVKDTTFQLDCGPSTDRRILTVNVPGNDDPSNTIMVGVSGGMDSSLTLYLVSALNSLQSIPYFIQPVAVDNRLGCSDDPTNKFANSINEYWSSIPKIINFVRSRVPNSNVLDLIKITADPSLRRDHQVSSTLLNLFRKKNCFYNYTYMYQGVNENPPALPNGPVRPNEEPMDLLKLPLLKLQKTHIVDAIIQLDLIEIFQLTPKCPSNHVSLNESCQVWQCNERRWAFDKLGLHEMGTKYFLNTKKAK